MRHLLLAAAALAGLSCTPKFQAQSDLTDLRVLAIRTDPPEALVDLDKGTVDDVRATVLVVDPAPRADARMTGHLCFPTDSRRCDSGGPSLPLPLVTHPVGATFSYLIQIPASMVRAALQDDKLKGLGGIRVQLSIELDDGDPMGPVSAAKLLLYSKNDHVPNHVPAIESLQLTRNGVPVGKVAPGQILQLSRGVAVGLRPVLASGSIEDYDTTDLTGKTVHLREQLSYSFYVSRSAEVDRETASEPLDSVAPPDGLTRIDSLAAGSGTLWVVVRDGRGGESWIQQAFSSD
jgi:hypothetical protein